MMSSKRHYLRTAFTNCPWRFFTFNKTSGVQTWAISLWTLAAFIHDENDWKVL